MALFICRRSWSPTGGAERYIQRLAGALGKMGVDSVLLTGPQWPEAAWPGDRIQRLPADDAQSFAVAAAHTRARHPDALLFAFERIPGADLFRAGDGLHRAWLERLAAEEGRLADGFRRLRKVHRQALRLESAMLGGNPAPRVIANSRMVANELERAFGLQGDRVMVIPNGFDAPRLPPDEGLRRRERIRSSLGCRPADSVILFVGSGWKRKGAQVLADAFRRLGRSDAHLVLVGKGEGEGLNHPGIHPVGPQDDPVDWFLGADLFALPTLYDPFSNACLEAAAFGLPVLTTDANGFAEVLKEHPTAGEVIPVPRDVEPWAAALQRWLDPARRAAAQPALDAVRGHYTVERNLDATLAFIRRSFPNR